MKGGGMKADEPGKRPGLLRTCGCLASCARRRSGLAT